MTERLPSALHDAARRVGAAAESAGVRPYLVGGTARDLALGISASMDLDVTLTGATEATFDVMAGALGASITSRSQFTATSLWLGEIHVDLVMTRAEDYPAPGSLPVVRPGTLAEDMARRDFSVNAMAVSLASDSWGELYDPHDGISDIQAGLLRVLHEGSFRDDATRILRAARYAARLSFDLSPETREALEASVGFMSTLSPARVRNELERVFREGKACADAMRLLDEWRALAAIDAALGYDARTWSEFHARTKGLSREGRVAVGYAALGAGMSETEVSRVAARLLPGALNRRVLGESAALGRSLSESSLAGLSNSALAARLDALSEYGVLGCALAASEADRARLDDYLDNLRPVRPTLNGDDLIALGVTRGPQVGRVLKSLRDARLDGLVADRRGEEAFVLDGLKASSE